MAYLLSAAVIVPVYGRLGDRLGKRDMLLVALGVFTLGSLACAAAQTMPQLVAARVLQGLGGGGMMMLSQALIGELVPPVERVKFQGYFAIIYALASIGGPVIGGVVVTHVSWRWLFLANLVFAAFATWRLSRLPAGERHPRAAGGVDLGGHVFFAIGALGTLYWLTSGGHRFAWLSVSSFAFAAVSALSIAVLIWHERRHAAPFLPLELYRERAIRLSMQLVLLFAACMFAIIFFLPIYLQLGFAVSPQMSGVLLLPVTFGQVMANFVCSYVMRRTGEPYLIPVVGMSCTTTAMVLLGLTEPNATVIGILGFFAGLGLGTIMPITTLVVQTVAGRAKLSVATAGLSLSRSTGGAAGAAIFGAIVFAMLPEVDRHSLVREASTLGAQRVLDAFHLGFLCVAAVAAFGVYTAARMPRVRLWEPDRKPQDDAPRAPD